MLYSGVIITYKNEINSMLLDTLFVDTVDLNRAFNRSKRSLDTERMPDQPDVY